MILVWLGVAILITTILLARTMFVVAVTPRSFHEPGQQLEEPLRISVLLPVRNEADRCLTDCIRSLLGQSTPPLELIVLNDQSTDDTAAILDQIGMRRPDIVRVVSGIEPPPGWQGKLFALEEAKRVSSGEWLLLTDADVTFSEHAFAAAQLAVRKSNLDALSLLPRIQMVTFWERLILPIMAWYSVMRVSPTQANRSSSRACFGVGNFILVRRDAHDSIGGFPSYRDNILDDCALMERLKAAGFRVAILDGSCHLTSRMYCGLREIIKGLAKNSFAALRFSSLRLLCFWCFELLAVFGPLVFFLFGIASDQSSFLLGLSGLSAGAMLTTHLVFAHRMDAAPWSPFLYPMGHIAGLAIVTYSALAHWRQLPIHWKDRNITSIYDPTQ